MIKARCGRHHNRARTRQAQEIFKVNLVHWRFPWHEEETAPLLECYIRRAREKVVRNPVRDRPRRLH